VSEHGGPSDLPGDAAYTRRKLLQVTGSGLVVVGAGGFLAACGGGGSSSSTSTAGTSPSGAPTGGTAGGTPKRGGTLNFGGQGGANTDTLDAHNGLTNTDFARLSMLYDGLVRQGDDGQPVLQLAESLTPNKDATKWTIKIRKGVIDHAGKEFGAKDVLFSFNRIVSKKYPGLNALGSINPGASKVVDTHTLLLKFDTPFSILPQALSLHWYLYMVPVGYDPKKPIGTGPFKVKSFTPGRQSVFVRHDQYWDHPKPYLDSVVTINVNDETAQVNGLQSGQLDAIDYLTAASIAALQANSNVSLVISDKSGGWEPFTMRVDKAPFSDVRVRQALRLVIDRPKMLESVFSGHGQIGNDIFGIYDPAFDKSLFPQRHQDVAQAKSLLKQAGHPSLSVQLITTPNAPGMVQAAQVFKTQASAAGINTTIVNQPVTDYFARSYLKVPFSEDYWQYAPYLVDVSQDSITGAPFSATKFSDRQYDSLFKQAIATIDETKRNQIIQEMMKIDYTRGGNIIPFFFPVIDAVNKKVHGVQPTVGGQAMRIFNFKEFWID
jgi:peptide/nickel transport system substrate-binding protein